MIRQETKTILDLFNTMGRDKKANLIATSNLTDREVNILTMRYVHGLTVKESSENISMEVEAFNKAQQKAIHKLYLFLTQ